MAQRRDVPGDVLNPEINDGEPSVPLCQLASFPTHGSRYPSDSAEHAAKNKNATMEKTVNPAVASIGFRLFADFGTPKSSPLIATHTRLREYSSRSNDRGQ